MTKSESAKGSKAGSGLREHIKLLVLVCCQLTDRPPLADAHLAEVVEQVLADHEPERSDHLGEELVQLIEKVSGAIGAQRDQPIV